MIKFLSDLFGAIYDFVKFIITSLGYFYKGALIVGIPLFLIAKLFDFIYK